MRLYELIWNRTVSSQMESAEFERTAIDFSNQSSSIVLELMALFRNLMDS